MDLQQYIPPRVLELISTYIPNKKLDHVHRTAKVATEVARQLVQSKSEALLQGKSNRDVMSLLVKANTSKNIKMQLNEEEMMAQLRNLIIAGHEPTTATLAWTLFELARHPEMQERLRQEIRIAESNLRRQGKTEFTASDFETMPYLIAVLKESLRFNSVPYHIYKQSTGDDVLPLSEPITTTSGEVITELPIPKGLKIILSIAGYNRNKDVFGLDSHTFNPDRWLNTENVKKGVPIGVYGNLLTFGAGVRSCLGWRFAIMELHAFLVELISNFEFSLTPEVIRREPALAMIPTVEGQVEKGAQLPLRVRLAPRDD